MMAHTVLRDFAAYPRQEVGALTPRTTVHRSYSLHYTHAHSLHSSRYKRTFFAANCTAASRRVSGVGTATPRESLGGRKQSPSPLRSVRRQQALMTAWGARTRAYSPTHSSTLPPRGVSGPAAAPSLGGGESLRTDQALSLWFSNSQVHRRVHPAAGGGGGGEGGGGHRRASGGHRGAHVRSLHGGQAAPPGQSVKTWGSHGSGGGAPAFIQTTNPRCVRW